MDSLPIRWVAMIFESLPQGHAQNFAYMRVAPNFERSGDMGAAYRQAMVDAVGDPQHGPVVRAAVERWLAQTEARAPPPQIDETCGHCGTLMHTLYFYKGKRYCSEECCHLAGDRRWCRIGGDCGCTPWAIKRRQLRKSRATMRVMQQVISDYELQGALARRLADEGDLTIAADDTMEEGSDVEDPMVTQANEISNVDNIVQLSRNMVELAETRRDLKRTRGSD